MYTLANVLHLPDGFPFVLLRDSSIIDSAAGEWANEVP